MTPAEETADAALKLLNRIIAGYPELNRRARIPSRPDGYPRRASGAQPGTITPTYDPDRQLAIGGISIDYADPTGLTATNGEHRPDPVTRRLRNLERNLNAALRNLEAAANQLIDPKDTDDNLAWCESCSRVKHPDGAPYLEPVYSKAKTKTDVGGRLPDPRYLCRFDYDYVLSEGKLPPVDFVRERLTKGRAPRKIA